MSERDFRIDTLHRVYAQYAPRKRRGRRPLRKRPAPAQEPEGGEKPAAETPQPELFDQEAPG